MRDESPGGGLEDVFEDLEQQAAGMHWAELDAELADRARGEYATVTWASRVHASVGRQVRLSLTGGSVVEGELVEAGEGWCVVAEHAQRAVWLVRLAAVTLASGISDRSLPEAARPAIARLGFGSALHRLGGQAPQVLVQVVDGSSHLVRLARVGADFVEAGRLDDAGPKAGLLLPFSSIRAVRVG